LANGTFEIQQFDFSFGIVREISSNNGNVSQVNLATENFTISITKTNATVTWICVGNLSNGATVNITVQIFNMANNVSFAGKKLHFSKRTMKFTISLTGWIFRSMRNSLQIFYDITSKNTASTDVSSNGQGNIKWHEVSTGDVALFGKFVEQAVIDGTVRYISFRPSETGIIAQVPYFWNTMVLDPDYSVLLENDGPSQVNSDGVSDQWGPLGEVTDLIICGAGVGVIAVVGVVVFMHRKWRQRDLMSQLNGIRLK